MKLYAMNSLPKCSCVGNSSSKRPTMVQSS